MNKSDLVDFISQKTNLPRKRAESVVNVIFDTMSETLVSGGRIEIRGFGSFVSKFYEEYQGRNPRTGEPIHVSPKRLPFFKVGKELREMVNGGPV
jgi:integration host factor subunit beta